jgi:hypothetical protein
MLTVVMYHYVRDLPRSRYPRIKGLQTSGFDAQLDHLCSKFRPCLPEELVAGGGRGGGTPPSRARRWLPAPQNRRSPQ